MKKYCKKICITCKIFAESAKICKIAGNEKYVFCDICKRYFSETLQI